MDHATGGENPTKNSDLEKSSDGELVQCFDLRSVLTDMFQTNGEKLVDSHTTNRGIILEESIAYMEDSGRLSRSKLEPYIIVDSELLETVRKSSRLLSTKGGLKLYCEEEGCSFETTNINSLRKHMMMHLGRVPFMCILCGENFECGDNATLHFKRAHIRQELKKLLKKYFPKTYKCGNKCGMVFKTKSSYQVHRFHSHIKDISHECKACGLVNSCIAALRKHMKQYIKLKSIFARSVV